ncbi:MAG: heavy-metal-associated domain-containing protein [Bacteroidetes bacterium]|nr:MAG: heavy-metal-associated domain-containing protein [Bacteroidota bacterium]REK06678.1 MAG: heavy-metal-associated domain-containing protein [Bacteroidota bacterium]REK33443.1 MAG: heavy-metal-associated domain-containing protein [Bacteroidota bacterium]REK49836.1 MAG: heavy-metal-associated domain-containing protein [Bacteroidota bacterium]
MMSATVSRAQNDTLVIQTNSVCNTCKKIIERDMMFEKGVKSASLNVESKELTLIYQEGKTDAGKLRIAVSKIGYDADNIPADAKARQRLPDCCKNPDAHH